MKVIFSNIVCFCMAIIVEGNHIRTKSLLDRIAANGTKINEIFQPSENGYLGEGMSGLVYKGILLPMQIEVAMKFIPDEFENYAKNELQAYIALDAVNNTEKEAYGIPTLYFYGQWKNYFMFGITLLDSEFINRRENNQLTTVDKLIVFREMVRISKYMHCHAGICQGDLHMRNIMFRKHQGFIIDFNLAIDTKKNMAVVDMCAKRDWRRFLAEFALTVGVNIDWTSQINPINKFQDIQPVGLRRVFSEVATAIYGNPILKYNELYGIIRDEIDCHNGNRPAIVSWLTPEQSRLALNDLSNNPIPSIESIN